MLDKPVDKKISSEPPFATKEAVIKIDIYRNGARVMTVPSGFGNAKIQVIETSNYQLMVKYI